MAINYHVEIWCDSTKVENNISSAGAEISWYFLILSFNIDGLISDGKSQRSKRVSENTLFCRNIS